MSENNLALTFAKTLHPEDFTMTTTIFDTDTIFAGVIWSGASGSSAVVLEGITVFNTSGNSALTIGASEVEVQVYGLLGATDGNTILFNGSSDNGSV